MVSPLFDISGRVALVTGASRGIGRAIAQGLAEAGASIALSSRTQDDLLKAAEEIRAVGARAEAFPADVEGQNIGTWEVRGADSFKEVYAALNRESPSGLYATVGPPILSNGKQIVDFATKGKLPYLQTSRAGIDTGSLMYRGDGSQSKFFSLLYPPNE